jgi:oxaloacetate decarboxylase alpha subunit
MKTTSSAARIPLRITDTTLRDAHQSLWATRMRSRDILDIIDTIDNTGYYSLEVWGGATFDVCLRFLRENPWERLRQIKARAKKTPLQMLLRGQNILGYRNYSDDVLERFIGLAVQNGVDIFRIFDALNDTRNLEQAIRMVKKFGGHAQGTLCYTISPVHTVANYVKVAKEQVALGIDSLAIKDMAGILSPIAAEKLVSALVKEVKIPIQVHSHLTSGMAIATYVEAVRAGAGAIDCAVSSMAGFSSQPPVETMAAIFEDMPWHANLDMDAISKACKYFTELAPRRQLSHHVADNIIDPEILKHHVPGGMISNLRGQLQQQNALDKLEAALEELPRVRKDLGYPPLVTPTSQILGSQAVLNVIAGERYAIVPQEVKDYVKGLYGRSPAPIDPKIQAKILGDEKPITCRPADLLEPMLPTATHNAPPSLIQNEEDILSYCLFPGPALDYFKWRALPAEERPPIPADLEAKADRPEAAGDKAAATAAAAPAAMLAAEDYNALHGLLDKVQSMGLSEFTVRKDDRVICIKGTGAPAASTAAPAPAKPSEAKAEKPAPKPAAPAAPAEVSGPTINAPIAGTFYVTKGPGKPPLVNEGDTVKAGDEVCIVEAMKLFNPIKAAFACKIVRMLCKPGDTVKKDQPLVQVEKV